MSLKLKPSNNHEELRNHIADLAIEGAKIKNCGKMCGSCAFKRDSEANIERKTVSDAMECLAYGHQQFNCHIEGGYDSGKPCAGFLNALQVVDPDRKTVVRYPKNIFNCLYCDKAHVDKGKYWRACQRNKSGVTKFVCSGCKGVHIFHYDFTNTIELFKNSKDEQRASRD